MLQISSDALEINLFHIKSVSSLFSSIKYRHIISNFDVGRTDVFNPSV